MGHYEVRRHEQRVNDFTVTFYFFSLAQSFNGYNLSSQYFTSAFVLKARQRFFQQLKPKKSDIFDYKIKSRAETIHSFIIRNRLSFAGSCRGWAGQFKFTLDKGGVYPGHVASSSQG